LLHIKGKRNVRTAQIECKASAMNQGDVFILDMGLTLYLVRPAPPRRVRAPLECMRMCL
jgi:hypothetical protein